MNATKYEIVNRNDQQVTMVTMVWVVAQDLPWVGDTVC